MTEALAFALGILLTWFWTRHRIVAWKESNRQLAVTLRETRIEKFDVERKLEHAERMLKGDSAPEVDRSNPDWWRKA